MALEALLQDYNFDLLENKNLVESKAVLSHLDKASIRQALFTGRVLIKAWAKSLDSSERKIKGQLFIDQLISRYWTYHFNSSVKLKKFNTSKTDLEIDRTATALANSLALSASVIDVTEACFHIGVFYTLLLSDTERSEKGAFYTPPNLVETIYSRIQHGGFDLHNKNVLDPACGSGIFLVFLCSRLSSECKSVKDATKLVNHVEKNIRGWEIDPYAAWLAQTFIAISLKDQLVRIKRNLNSVVEVGDSLEISLEHNTLYDLVIGNPPYGKIKLNPILRKNFSRSLYGHANLYGIFMDIALSKTRVDGLIAFVTPTSYLAGEYFKVLRELYSNNTIPINFDFVKSRKGIFEDVLQETVLSLFQRRKPKSESFYSVNEVESFVNDKNEYQTSNTLLGRFKNIGINSNPWILPRRESQKTIVSSISNNSQRLADWGYEINTGQLVWNRHKKQLRNSSGKNCYSLVWAESIMPNGSFLLKATKTNHTPFIEVHNKDQYLITRTQCLLVQRTTSKEQDKRLIAALLPNALARNGVVVENHINIIKPVNPKVSLQVLSFFLNSRIVDEIFRCLSGSVAVSAYELESIPLPKYSELATLNKLISKKAPVVKIEKEINRLYNFK
ncbi:SAM-dependent methyltransferase [Sphingobacteriaceae bacterium]|nr:SAM-dependent methyltransferase [Sphingobacteriaceae bacterium]